MVSNFDSLYSYSQNSHKGNWEEDPLTVVKNMYDVTALACEPNGTLVLLGAALTTVRLKYFTRLKRN